MKENPKLKVTIPNFAQDELIDSAMKKIK